MKMPFGRYLGVEVADLPDDYLRWLHEAIDLREPLCSAVEAEYEFRFTARIAHKPLPDDVRQMASELVSAGYRKLSQQHHPDKGGSTKSMQSVNAAADF